MSPPRDTQALQTHEAPRSSGRSRRLVDALLDGGHPSDSVALADADERVDRAALRRRVATRRRELGLSDARRAIVILFGERSIEFVVTYLALLADGHVPLLAASHVDELAEHWSPLAVVHARHDGIDVNRVAHHGEGVELHSDLALLMSTSGSTGSPKLVRLSQQNLLSNAQSIATMLALRSGDVGITTLPLHYCYGLSVLHSHLVAGASIVCCEASVVDPCFAASARENRVTNIAGVPHTFELLERNTAAIEDLDSLRLLTQAGGRMAPDRVRDWAAWSAQRAVDFVVMYGQTEATARMAYLPPHLASVTPWAIGGSIPGGELSLQPHPSAPDENSGELVYRGPNVMMGYAEQPADLAGGPRLDVLATGDLARFDAERGVYEIVGRAARFIKPFGVRVDLDRVEQQLREHGWVSAVGGDDNGLRIAVVGPEVAALHTAVQAMCALPSTRISVVECSELPLTRSGKVDYTAVCALAEPAEVPVVRVPEQTSGGTTAQICATVGAVLGRHGVSGDDTFIALGGDSLNYIECSLRLERLVGTLPTDWHLRPLRTLTTTQQGRARLDTTLLLRAFSICAVVSTHMGLYRFPGGAHLLLTVVGYNVARFLLPIENARARARAGLRTAARVAIPTSAWIGINMLIAGGYSVGTVALVNNYFGSPWRTDGRWRYWFFEVFVQLLVITTALIAVPAVRRFERRHRLALPLLVLLPLCLVRFDVISITDRYNHYFRTHDVAWFFVLGWAIRQATARHERLLVVVVALVLVPGYFDRPQREWFIIGGLLLLISAPTLPLPRLLHRPIGVLAAASMWIFLVHWQVFPALDAAFLRWFAYLLTLAVGVAVWRIAQTTTPHMEVFARNCARRLTRYRQRTSITAPTGS